LREHGIHCTEEAAMNGRVNVVRDARPPSVPS